MRVRFDSPFRWHFKITAIEEAGSFSKLVLGCSLGAIRIEEVSDCIFPGSVDNGLMEESGISVSRDRPVLFVPLSVISFFSG